MCGRISKKISVKVDSYLGQKAFYDINGLLEFVLDDMSLVELAIGTSCATFLLIRSIIRHYSNFVPNEVDFSSYFPLNPHFLSGMKTKA